MKILVLGDQAPTGFGSVTRCKKLKTSPFAPASRSFAKNASGSSTNS